MALPKTVDALIRVFEEQHPSHRDGSHLTVSRTVSILAVLYEKARNAVEFRAEHLVRRASIERILKRRMLINGGANTIAENLIVELLWARYIDSSFIDDAKVSEIQAIVNRYVHVKHDLYALGSQAHGVSWDTLMGLASSEIEETLVSPKKREALNNFFYQVIRPKIIIPDVDERKINMLTYIAVEKAFSQSDDALIMHHLLKMIYPSWFDAKEQLPENLQPVFQNIQLIQSMSRDHLGEPLYRFVRRRTPPFLLLRDFFLHEGEHVREIIEDPEKFEQKLSELAAQRYHEIGAKVQRAVVRSLIYIFCTKMLFALALEAPFDMFIAKKISYIPLAINTLFPPLLLFLVAGLFSVPGAENTKKLIERIKEIVYRFDESLKEGDPFMITPKTSRPLLAAVFSVFYLGTFLLSFGIITFILTRLHFSIASQIIFVFFITLVSFFAYRIRQSAKEYEIVDRQGFLGPLVDFFFLPILRVGQLLSSEIAKLNIFIFLFDFILEAPLKVIFEVVEEWIRFIRTKKEEII